MSKWYMADSLNDEVKAISIVTLNTKCLFDKFSELPQMFSMNFKTDSTFHTNKRLSVP